MADTEDILSVHDPYLDEDEILAGSESVPEPSTSRGSEQKRITFPYSAQSDTDIIQDVLQRNTEAVAALVRSMSAKKKRTRKRSVSSSSCESPILKHKKKRYYKSSEKRTRRVSETTQASHSNLEETGNVLSDGEIIDDLFCPPDNDYRGERDEGALGAAGDWFAEANNEYEVDEEITDPLSENLAKFVEKRFCTTMKDDKMKEKVSKYKRPGNCEALLVRQTNPEIWKLLQSGGKKNDAKYTSIQKTIAKATTAVAQCADLLVKDGESKRPIVQKLLDVISILGHSQQKITSRRKEAQRWALPMNMKGICDVPIDGTKFLYGDDIKKTIHDANEQRKMVQFSSPRATHANAYTSAYGKPAQRDRKRHFLAYQAGRPSGQRGRGYAHRPSASHAAVANKRK
ncbi:uncharacterized protein LOC106013680 [Aplysia californica]|uniref:Uncharacterized protein LOC106013680 n=1 Tax=Aplysia californica TaxID=6500 RepID=A0ABM1ADA8_APLCA|nr:uncharacterized protein LOC106013680 [Aplysia californica]